MDGVFRKVCAIVLALYKYIFNVKNAKSKYTKDFGLGKTGRGDECHSSSMSRFQDSELLLESSRIRAHNPARGAALDLTSALCDALPSAPNRPNVRL
jgi:hypothetical protein